MGEYQWRQHLDTNRFVTNWDTGYQNDVTGGSDDDISWSYAEGFEGIVKGMGTDMSDANVILWANTQWVFRSTDGGITFNNIFTDTISTNWWKSNGLDNVNIMDVEISKANENIVYAGFFDLGFWRSLDGGKSWQSGNHALYTGGWNGFGGNVASIVSDPGRSNVVWTTMSGNQMGEDVTYLLKSSSYGESSSWQLSNAGLPTNEVMGLSIDKNSAANNRVLFVTANGHVYKSTNDGSSWLPLTMAFLPMAAFDLQLLTM